MKTLERKNLCPRVWKHLRSRKSGKLFCNEETVPKVPHFLMIGRNVGDVRKEKFLLVRLVVKDCVWELFFSNNWKHSRQVVQQIYLLVNPLTPRQLFLSWEADFFCTTCKGTLLDHIFFYFFQNSSGPSINVHKYFSFWRSLLHKYCAFLNIFKSF